MTFFFIHILSIPKTTMTLQLFVKTDKINWMTLSKNPHKDLIKIITPDTINKLDWSEICRCAYTDGMFDLIDKNIHQIQWWGMSQNKHDRAIDILEKNVNNIDWDMLSENQNPRAIALLKLNTSRVNWYDLCRTASSSAAFDFIENNNANINWVGLCQNQNKHAVSLIKKNFTNLSEHHHYWLSQHKDKSILDMLAKHKYTITQIVNGEDTEVTMSVVSPWMISKNTSNQAINIIKTEKELLDWRSLCLNTNPLALKMLKQNEDKICWFLLSENPHDEAVKLLKANQDKINWTYLSKNINDKALMLLYYAILNRKNDDILEQVDWYELCKNQSPVVVKILSVFPEYINWQVFSANKNLFM